VAVLEQNLGSGWQFDTRVVFDVPCAEVAPWIHAPMGRLEAHGDGCVLVGTTRNPTMYAGDWLARLPFASRVEGSPELEAAVRTLAARFTSAMARA
jgi:hypothetical protein